MPSADLAYSVLKLKFRQMKNVIISRGVCVWGGGDNLRVIVVREFNPVF